MKIVLPAGFSRARSFSHALMTRNSSPRRGCVVDKPPCSTCCGQECSAHTQQDEDGDHQPLGLTQRQMKCQAQHHARFDC
jgi:hypothetical protein